MASSKTNPYASPDEDPEPRQSHRTSLLYEFILFGGIASMIGGAAIGTMQHTFSGAPTIGGMMFFAGFVALIVSLR